ncbi:MAG: lytic transglycosylase domain-containing protein [Acidobacteriota bacterium]
MTIPVLAALLLAAHARAAEQVTLTNGFVERCDHHAQVDGHVRLYLDSGEDSYIEFAPGQIASVQAVPGPPPEQPLAQAHKTGRKLNSADLGEMLAHAGQQHNVDVDLLASVVKAESNGNAHAVSRAGAEGLMQVVPGTAAVLGVHDRFQPDENVQGGTAYLDALLTRYHDNLALALAAYNAGPQAVDKYHGIPPYRETRLYVARVIHEFNRRVLAREAAARARAEAHGPEPPPSR